MSALGLVRSYAREHGVTYPDMAWEPKKSFHAVAGFYAAHQLPQRTGAVTQIAPGGWTESRPGRVVPDMRRAR